MDSPKISIFADIIERYKIEPADQKRLVETAEHNMQLTDTLPRIKGMLLKLSKTVGQIRRETEFTMDPEQVRLIRGVLWMFTALNGAITEDALADAKSFLAAHCRKLHLEFYATDHVAQQQINFYLEEVSVHILDQYMAMIVESVKPRPVCDLPDTMNTFFWNSDNVIDQKVLTDELKEEILACYGMLAFARVRARCVSGSTSKEGKDKLAVVMASDLLKERTLHVGKHYDSYDWQEFFNSNIRVDEDGYTCAKNNLDINVDLS